METKKVSKKTIKTIVEWVLIIAVAYLLARGINTFFLEKVETPTGSMEETIMVGDKYLMNKLAYKFSNPKRGDIVIFWDPAEPKNPDAKLFKRIIGMPGETISFEDGHVYINGELLEEEYVHGKETWDKGITSYDIPENCYFMMGDNRTASIDARSWDQPFVDRSLLIGKVFMRYSPSIKFVKKAKYNL
ncbi:MAG: signal peptidase I [Clostridiales bacterium]|nr:signal peptidase I [Clostridiales bacterium]